MSRYRKTARVLAAACGVVWAAAAANAQVLPSPAAPAQTSRTSTSQVSGQTPSAPAQTRTATSGGIQQAGAELPNGSQGVISADHLFNSPASQPVTQTGHRRAARQCGRQCNCPRCQAAACGGWWGEDFTTCLFNSDAEKFDLSDSFWEAMDLESPIDFGGWVSAGYHNKSDGVFNTVPHHFNVHQTWLYIDKGADGSEGLDWGFRFDAVYGIDGENTQSYGNNPGRWDFLNGYDHGVYHWALPQLYGVLAYDKLTVRLGHFYTLAGYEAVPSLSRPFYSGAFSWNYAEPFTHTGVLGSYELSEDVTLHAGWVLGWDSGFDRFNDATAAHLGFVVKLIDEVTLSYMTVVGNNGWIGDGYTQHIVLTVPLTDDLTYVAVSDYVHGTADLFGGTNYEAISFYNYLLYSLNDFVKVNGRAEWFKAQSTSYYEITGGLLLQPTPNFTIRPEIRYQWSPAAQHVGGANPIGLPNLGEAIFGIDAILTF